MVFKQLIVLCILLMLPTKVIGVDCPDRACIAKLYKSKVIKAEYYIRPLGSSGYSSGSSGKKRRKRYDYYLLHAGVVVTLARSVQGQNRWLIHKGQDYGDRWDTVITDANYMSSRWSLTKLAYVSYCNKDVNDFMRAGVILRRYNLLGPNCQTAANGMWDMVERCRASSETKHFNCFLCLVISLLFLFFPH